MQFFVYILRTSRNTLYIGQTNNLQKRLEEHANKTSKSAKYMRCFDSFDHVYTEIYPSRQEAMQREYQLKKWPKAKKEALIRNSKLPLLPLFTNYPNLIVGLSTKEDKPMKLRYDAAYDDRILEHRNKFLSTFAITPQQLVSAQLIQKNNVVAVSHKDAGTSITNTDGLITHQNGLFLSITVADCLPIFLYDHKKAIIGLIHAGWKGLASHIITNTITTFKKQYCSNPHELVVGIGPGIGVCHFAVQEDVLNTFAAYPKAVTRKNDTEFLDLKQIAKQQLIDNGVQAQHIEINPLCTFCENSRYYSYRRDHATPLEAMMAVIGMKH